VLVSGFLLGMVSLVLRRRKVLGTCGLGLAAAAVVLGGWSVPERAVTQSVFVGLDWFLLNLFVLALLFVPLERLFPRVREQGTFRGGWRTDLAHFFVSHLLVQVSVFLTVAPARVFFHWAANDGVQRWIGSQPGWLQFVEILVVSDFCEYWIHRLEHRSPFLWRFHAIHHSSELLDWLAGSRLHLGDIALVRAATFVPLYILGFDDRAILAYVGFVSFHAVFIHANVGFRFGWLDHVFVTPRFHHWHHAAEERAIDRNFAVHLPVLDRIFGTLLLPPGDAWPSAYGIAGHPIPENFLVHTAWPFAHGRFERPKM
jgi:lathosterol oxidase